MRRPLLAALLGLPLLLAGCSQGDEAGRGSAATSDAGDDLAGEGSGDAAAARGDEAAAEEAAADGGGRDALDVPLVPAVTGRELARSARIVVEVEDVERAAAQVIATAQRLGGFVADSDVRAAATDGGAEGFGVLTLRVPATSLDTAVRDLGELGVRRRSTSISTEDLTDQLTDVRARLRNLRALEGELTQLLGTVEETDPRAEELLRVYARIDEVRGQVERLQAQEAAAADRVALATVTVELQPVAVAAAVDGASDVPVVAEAWAATRGAFGVMGELAVWLLVTVLPVAAVVLGVPALALWGLLRLRATARRDGTDAPPSPASAAPPQDREGAPVP